MKKSFRQRDKYDLRDKSIGKRLTVVCKKNSYSQGSYRLWPFWFFISLSRYRLYLTRTRTRASRTWRAHVMLHIHKSRASQQRFRERLQHAHRVNSSGVMYDNANNAQPRANERTIGRSVPLSFAIASTVLVCPRCLLLDVGIKHSVLHPLNRNFLRLWIQAYFLSLNWLNNADRKDLFFLLSPLVQIIPRQISNYSQSLNRSTDCKFPVLSMIILLFLETSSVRPDCGRERLVIRRWCRSVPQHGNAYTRDAAGRVTSPVIASTWAIH